MGSAAGLQKGRRNNLCEFLGKINQIIYIQCYKKMQ
jgi:hypothetical protein